MSVKNSSVIIDLQTRLRKFKTEYALEFKERLEAKTPVRTGALKNSYVIKQKQTGFQIESIEDYFGYVNNGTPFQRPQRMVERTLAEKDSIAEVAAQRAGLKR